MYIYVYICMCIYIYNIYIEISQRKNRFLKYFGYCLLLINRINRLTFFTIPFHIYKFL